MLLANLALIAGFLVLIASALIPTIHFGVLASVAMLGGLAGNLVILPLLLQILWRPRTTPAQASRMKKLVIGREGRSYHQHADFAVRPRRHAVRNEDERPFRF